MKQHIGMYDHLKCLYWDTLQVSVCNIQIDLISRSPEVKRSPIFDLAQNLE